MRISTQHTVAIAVASLAALAAHVVAPSANPRPDQALVAVAWTQHAAERVALCRQVFAHARTQLDAALADAETSAALEQIGARELQRLSPAVIVDVDETVLDNAPYNARLVADNRTYEPKTWSSWVQERRAQAVPGAVAFLTHAATRGVTVFYVTNRDTNDEAATRDNLARLGLPLQDEGDLDVVLTKNEQPEWTSDKRTRRAHVARTHRVVMLLGDDLGDFLGAVKPARSLRNGDALDVVRAHGQELQGERLARVHEFGELWGTRWFLLPNPMYGSWLETFEAAAASGD